MPRTMRRPPLTVRSAWRGGGAEQSCERDRRTAEVARYHTCTFRIVAAAAAITADTTTETFEVEVKREGSSGGAMAS